MTSSPKRKPGRTRALEAAAPHTLPAITESSFPQFQTKTAAHRLCVSAAAPIRNGVGLLPRSRRPGKALTLVLPHLPPTNPNHLTGSVPSQFFSAKKRRPSSRKADPSSTGSQHGSPGAAKGSLAGYLVRSPPAAAAAASSVAPARSPGGGDARARRSLSAAMNVDNSAAAMNVDSATVTAGYGDDTEMKKFTMEFLSHYCR